MNFFKITLTLLIFSILEVKSTLLTKEDLEAYWETSISVMSIARKYIALVDIPNECDRMELKDAEGEPYCYYGTERPKGKGLLLDNETDQTVQAVAQGDYLVFNQMPEEATDLLNELFCTLISTDRNAESYKTFIAKAQAKLAKKDVYDTTIDFIKKNLTELNSHSKADGTLLCGLFCRNGLPVQALHVLGSFEFCGPTATPQIFPEGGVFINDGREIRGIQPSIFLDTYLLSNGQKLKTLEEIPVVIL